MTVEHRRFVDAAGGQRRHALKPRGGVPVLRRVHDPARQRDHRQRPGVPAEVKAVFCLRRDAHVEQVLGDVGPLLVRADQNGHLRAAKPSLFVMSNAGFEGLVQELLTGGAVLVAHGLDMHLAFKLLLRRLTMVVVHLGQIRRQPALHGVEKRPVPFHNGRTTPPVGVEQLVVKGVVKRPSGVGEGPFVVVHDVGQLQQLAVVAVAPAVDGLFAVADHKGPVAL